MSIVVKLSYEEQIINALARVEHRRGEDFLARAHRDAEAIREVLAPLRVENAQLRCALTKWCCACWYGLDSDPPYSARPAVVRVRWSARDNAVCTEHVADEIVNIALDHACDRGGLRVQIELFVDAVDQHRVLALPSPPPFDELRAHVSRGCAAARAWLNEAYPDWRDRTVSGMSKDQRAELLGCVQAALGEPQRSAP